MSKYPLFLDHLTNSFSYFSVLNAGKSLSQTKSFITNLLVQRERSPHDNCIVMLAYLLEVCNQSEECFQYILSLPSPFALYANFYDWIFIAVDKFVKGHGVSYTVGSPLAHHYRSKVKESLFIFEDNIRA